MSRDKAKKPQPKNKAARKTKAEKKIVLPPSGLAEDILRQFSDQPGPKGAGVARPQEKENADDVRESAPEKYVTFFLGDEEFGLLIDQVREIERVGDITRVPNSAEYIKGVVNLRGKIVPVIELKKKLEIGSSEIGSASRIVVIDYGTEILGLLVDRVSRIVSIYPGQVEAIPEDIAKKGKDYIESVAKIDDQIISLVDLESAVSKERDRGNP